MTAVTRALMDLANAMPCLAASFEWCPGQKPHRQVEGLPDDTGANAGAALPPAWVASGEDCGNKTDGQRE
jgi:hypothetical protein